MSMAMQEDYSNACSSKKPHKLRSLTEDLVAYFVKLSRLISSFISLVSIVPSSRGLSLSSSCFFSSLPCPAFPPGIGRGLVFLWVSPPREDPDTPEGCDFSEGRAAAGVAVGPNWFVLLPLPLLSDPRPLLFSSVLGNLS